MARTLFLRDFAGDLPASKAKVLYAVQQPFQKAFAVRPDYAGRVAIEAELLSVSTEDRTINPDLQRLMASG